MNEESTDVLGVSNTVENNLANENTTTNLTVDVNPVSNNIEENPQNVDICCKNEEIQTINTALQPIDNVPIEMAQNETNYKEIDKTIASKPEDFGNKIENDGSLDKPIDTAPLEMAQNETNYKEIDKNIASKLEDYENKIENDLTEDKSDKNTNENSNNPEITKMDSENAEYFSDSSESESSDSDSSSECELSGGDSLREEVTRRIKCEDSNEKLVSVFGQILLGRSEEEESGIVALPVGCGIKLVGNISSIIEDKVVVVRSLPGIPALNLDSALFLKDRSPLGVIQETFGPVASPLYVVCLRDAGKSKDLQVEEEIYFAPESEEFTSFVLMQQVRQMRGSDASWIGDGEPPPGNVDYSDDEEERSHKKKSNKRKITPARTENIQSFSRPPQNFSRPPQNYNRARLQNNPHWQHRPTHCSPNYPTYRHPRPPQMGPYPQHPWQEIAMSFNRPPNYRQQFFQRPRQNLDYPSSNQVHEVLRLFNHPPK